MAHAALAIMQQPMHQQPTHQQSKQQPQPPLLVDVVVPPGAVPGQLLLVHAPDGTACKATVRP